MMDPAPVLDCRAESCGDVVLMSQDLDSEVSNVAPRKDGIAGGGYADFNGQDGDVAISTQLSPRVKEMADLTALRAELFIECGGVAGTEELALTHYQFVVKDNRKRSGARAA